MQQLVTLVMKYGVIMLKYVKLILFNLVTKLILLLTLATAGIVNDINYYKFLEVREGAIDKLLLKDMKSLFFITIGKLVVSVMLLEFLSVPRETLNV